MSTTCIIYSGGMREKFQILTPQIHITQSYETIIFAFSDIYSTKIFLYFHVFLGCEGARDLKMNVSKEGYVIYIQFQI